MKKYQVLREATRTHAVTVMAGSPEEAVRKARAKLLREWKPIDGDFGYGPIDSVTEQCNGGRAFEVCGSRVEEVR